MRHDVFAPRQSVPVDRCGHCDAVVDRVWFVPGDVEQSCRDCYVEAMGSEPVHHQGHSSTPAVSSMRQPARRHASFPRWRAS